MSAELIGILGVGATLLVGLGGLLLALWSRTDKRMDAFQARTEQRMDAFQARTEERMDAYQARTEQRMDRIGGKMSEALGEVRTELRKLGERVARLEALAEIRPAVGSAPGD